MTTAERVSRRHLPMTIMSRDFAERIAEAHKRQYGCPLEVEHHEPRHGLMVYKLICPAGWAGGRVTRAYDFALGCMAMLTS